MDQEIIKEMVGFKIKMIIKNLEHNHSMGEIVWKISLVLIKIVIKNSKLINKKKELKIVFI